MVKMFFDKVVMLKIQKYFLDNFKIIKMAIWSHYRDRGLTESSSPYKITSKKVRKHFLKDLLKIPQFFFIVKLFF